MVHATSLRGNPWVGQKNWILRPPAFGTLLFWLLCWAVNATHHHLAATD